VDQVFSELMRVSFLTIGMPKNEMKKITISQCQMLSDPMFHLPTSTRTIQRTMEDGTCLHLR